MSFSNKDLLRMEHDSYISPHETSLLLYRNHPFTRQNDSQLTEKPNINPLAQSKVLARVKDFLELTTGTVKGPQHDARNSSLMNGNIEELTGNEPEIIEMDLMLGIADLYTPEAVDAAGVSVVSACNHESCLKSNGSNGPGDGDDDDDGDGDRKVSNHLWKRIEFGDGPRVSQETKWHGGRKRPKIMELP